MKLYELPRQKTIVRSEHVLEGKPFIFHNIDGMYSYCTTMDGSVFHPVAWLEVELVDADKS